MTYKLAPTDQQRILLLYAQRDRISAEISGVLDGTLPYIEKHSEVTADELAKHFGLTAPNANNRLVRLMRVGILTREALPSNGARGGRKFLYSLV